tara:strand:- start:2392 stop:3180 length:789 start_codon:yes stop_codon:yes gene_type:complete
MKIPSLLIAGSLAIFPLVSSNQLLAENNKENLFPKETSIGYFQPGLKIWNLNYDKKDAIKNYKEAIKDYKKALDLNPNNVYALLFRAEHNWKQENYDNALIDLNTVLRIDPENKYAIYDRAKVHADAGRHLLAIKHYSESIEKGIELEYAYANRGILHSWTGNAADACSDWRKSISIGKESASEYAAEQFKGKCEKDVFETFNREVKASFFSRSARKKYDLGDRKGACKDYFVAKKYGYKSKRAILIDELLVNSYCFVITKR